MVPGQDQKKYSIPVEDWEKAHGQTLEAGLYRGTMRKGKSEAQMGCAMSEMHKAAAELSADDDHKGSRIKKRNGWRLALRTPFCTHV